MLVRAPPLCHLATDTGEVDTQAAAALENGASQSTEAIADQLSEVRFRFEVEDL